MAKNFLVHVVDEIPLSALDEQNFEALRRVAGPGGSVPALAISVPALPESGSSAVADIAGPCFFDLGYVLGVSTTPCSRQPCFFCHMSKQEIKEQRPALSLLLPSRPDLLKAMKSL